MPIAGIAQPDIVAIGETLRLRRYNGNHSFALAWYQDPELVWLVDGIRTPYTPERLARMYAYLNAHGECWFIEAWENSAFRPIGDVTFWQMDMPIVIGEAAYRGHGVGTRVVEALVRRGRRLGYRELFISDIYHYNTASRRCFEKAGFRAFEATEKGSRYRLVLREAPADGKM